MDFLADGPRIVGHRGDPARFPDNSLSGIMSGLSADGRVEVDVRLTGDGRLILSHDPGVGDMVIGRTPWPDLSVIDIGGHRLCLLDEALGVPGGLDLEVKNLPGEPDFDPSGRLALMVAARARPTDVLTSFYWPDMDLVRRRAPRVATGLLVGEGGSTDDVIAHALAGGHRVIAPQDALVDEPLVAQAGSKGLEVMAWTVNEAHRAAELFEWGVAAIISDHPHGINTASREQARR